MRPFNPVVSYRVKGLVRPFTKRFRSAQLGSHGRDGEVQYVDRAHWGLLPFDTQDITRTILNSNSLFCRNALSALPEKRVRRA